MPDFANVIKGLECCLPPHDPNCDICPYDSIDLRCRAQLRDDVMALLKAQEPRLVTESDFEGADEYGYLPVFTEEKDGNMYFECIPKVAITDPDGIGVLRYWTSRPTDEQREATPWSKD